MADQHGTETLGPGLRVKRALRRKDMTAPSVASLKAEQVQSQVSQKQMSQIVEADPGVVRHNGDPPDSECGSKSSATPEDSDPDKLDLRK